MENYFLSEAKKARFLSEARGSYNAQKVEKKWQKVWRQNKTFQPDLKKAKRPFYNLMMFPYPSGEGLHVGNMYAFTGADIYGRFKRMQGFDVFEPIGLDGFGIHSENYAIKLGRHPAKVSKETEKNFYRQLEATGNAYAWDNILETYDPDYYKWTQWVFVQMFKHGLAYRKKTPVNWCPSCKTVLADEQVVSGKCERCDSPAEKQDLEQWFFKITDYAERLLKNLEWVDWSERVKVGQHNWIGCSEGTEIDFPLSTPVHPDFPNLPGPITVFTTRPDTIFGVTALVLAPEHPLIQSLIDPAQPLTSSNSPVKSFKDPLSSFKDGVRRYVDASKRKSDLERTELAKEKTGVNTGLFAKNPINGERVPIWVGDYVIGWYGGGAVMVVPAHDQRDFDFAKKYDLPVKAVISPDHEEELLPNHCGVAYEGEGTLVDSGEFSGLPSEIACRRITEWLEKEGLGRETVSYKLRDWVFSRQRYWGEPIPLIHCPKCGVVPVSENQLPVELPYVEKYEPAGTGESPLATIKDWVNVACPKCGRPAKRETDTMPNWAGSCWYFLRFVDPHNDKAVFDFAKVSPSEPLATLNQPLQPAGGWLPVDWYLGGAEHAVLHLLYARFWVKAMFDLGLVKFKEPFLRLRGVGMVQGEDGRKMSKSYGNVVNPDDVIEAFGADTLRIYEMFMGPFSQAINWNTSGVEGAHRFLKKIWTLVNSGSSGSSVTSGPSPLRRHLHRLIKKVGEDIESLKFNTAIAAMMEFLNDVVAHNQNDVVANFSSRPDGCGLSVEEWGIFLRLLAPFAPHITEELWQRLNSNSVVAQFTARSSVHSQPWPSCDPKLLEEEEVTIIVQVDGKVRGRLKVKKDTARAELRILAEQSSNVRRFLSGRRVKEMYLVPNRLINFATEPK